MTDEKALAFGQYLKTLRKEKGLTLTELADLIDMSNPYLSQIETGKRGIPTIDLLEKLSEPLGVRFFTLLEKAVEIKTNKKILPDRELFDYDLTNLLQHEKLNINRHKLSEEERAKILEMIYVLFPEKRETTDTDKK